MLEACAGPQVQIYIRTLSLWIAIIKVVSSKEVRLLALAIGVSKSGVHRWEKLL